MGIIWYLKHRSGSSSSESWTICHQAATVIAHCLLLDVSSSLFPDLLYFEKNPQNNSICILFLRWDGCLQTGMRNMASIYRPYMQEATMYCTVSIQQQTSIKIRMDAVSSLCCFLWYFQWKMMVKWKGKSVKTEYMSISTDSNLNYWLTERNLSKEVWKYTQCVI